MTKIDTLIIGAGHAGAQCAIALRQNGYSGSISLIGREDELPYERPPLSKEYFAREKTFERLHIRPAQFWRDKEITLHLGCEALAVDPARKIVMLSHGDPVHYGTLVWATGGDPRGLSCPGADLAGVHTIRTRADCDRLMGEINDGVRQVAIIGGGYIGLEAASVLIKLGCEVTLLEAAARILARVAGPEISSFFEQEHRAHGVDLRTGVQVCALEGDTRVSGVRLADDSVLPAQAVIVGIGIVTAVAPLLRAGAKGEHGLHVDRLCRTSLPDVYAIGDCAAFACDFAGGQVMRVESVQNANDQAICVAKAICGEAEPYHALPWFWSNQYDLRLQTAGISQGYDATVLRGDRDARSFSLVYLKEGRVIALDCVNAVKDYVQGRKLVELGAVVPPHLLADDTIPLKEFCSQPADLALNCR